MMMKTLRQLLPAAFVLALMPDAAWSAEKNASAAASKKLLEMIATGNAYPASELMPLYEQLEPVSIDFMFGTWRGGKFDGGKDPDPIRWFGKRFVSRDHADPLLARTAEGAVYSYDGLGFARLREAAFGGKTTAALIYDKQPIMDYFRKLNEQMVIGLGDIKGKPTDFFFHLTRANDVVVIEKPAPTK